MDPGLAQSLTARNHHLDDLFCSKVLKLKEKRKGEEENTEFEEEKAEDNGYQLVEKVGVSVSFTLFLGDFDIFQNYRLQ